MFGMMEYTKNALTQDTHGYLCLISISLPLGEKKNNGKNNVKVLKMDFFHYECDNITYV